MILSGPMMNISEFSEPVRLVKDPSKSLLASEVGNGGDMQDPDELRKKNSFSRRQKKTKMISGKDDNSALTNNIDEIPWALEDFDGQHSYISQSIDPDSRYVIFVNEGNEFRVLLVDKWFKFTPKLAYNPMSLQEAEERMAGQKKNEDADRWIMRHRSAAIKASKEENKSKPYFMILDEMNLSHVERYFADFLSIMESKEKLKLYSGEKRYSQYTKENEFDVIVVGGGPSGSSTTMFLSKAGKKVLLLDLVYF
jgi:hypothetical protein